MLTQLSTLKSRLGLELFATDDDALLTSILKRVTARFNAECNRVFDYGAGVTFEFRADQRNILVDRSPIESVSAGGNVVQKFQSTDLLPQVKVVLRHYERWIN